MTTTDLKAPPEALPVLDKGFVALIESTGSDLGVVNAARVSFHKRSEELDEGGEGIIRFLLQGRHGTPFEHNQFTFHVKAPIFVFREWHRHRIASINEMSARYTELPAEWYVPNRMDIRHQVGKPGAYVFETMEDDEQAAEIQHAIDQASADAFRCYRQMLEQGVAKEVARLVLPVNTYSEMYWTVNARALMNFLSLRNSDFAQREIRQYAMAMEALFRIQMPITYSAFIDNGRVAP